MTISVLPIYFQIRDSSSVAALHMCDNIIKSI